MLQSLHHLLFFPMGRLRILSSMAAIFLILATSSIPLAQSSAYDANFTTCKASFHCGNLPQELKYPFWGDSRPEYCGHPAFRLDCPLDSNPSISILNSSFQVRDVNGSGYTMRISRMNLSGNCPVEFNTTKLDDKYFQIAPGLSRILRIFSGCSPEFSRKYHPYSFECVGLSGDMTGSIYLDESEFSSFSPDEQRNLTNSCTHNVDVPMDNQTFGKLFEHEIKLYEAINEGFDVKYNTEFAANCSACEHTKGVCGTTNSSSSDGQFVCFYPR